MAEVRPFRALRYGERAGPLADLVAPPFDVISPEQREKLTSHSPYNVVHLTLPDSEEQAARDLAAWRRDVVLVRDEEPSFWALSQRYVGPDGVERTRNGIVASLRVEPYERRVVLPHERTHAGPKEGRLRLLRALRTQLEPIFLLHEGEPVELPDREPDLEVAGDRLWRVDEGPDVADRQLLIADGHHRYETTLAFHAEDGTEASAWMMVVLVSTREEGLTIFPTHRVAERARDVDGSRLAGVDDALGRLRSASPERAAAVLYRGADVRLLTGEEGELDTALVERLAAGRVSYTPDAHEATAAVDRGEAGAAFLLRPTRIEQVFAVAQRGETMPQKSTYFYPKLTSGLLLHPV